MSININSPGNTPGGINVQSDPVNPGTSKGKPGAPASGGGGADKVTLTNTAEQLQRLDKQLQDTPDVDSARVEAIRSAIEDGSFEIDTGAIADKLIQTDKDIGG